MAVKPSLRIAHGILVFPRLKPGIPIPNSRRLSRGWLWCITWCLLCPGAASLEAQDTAMTQAPAAKPSSFPSATKAPCASNASSGFRKRAVPQSAKHEDHANTDTMSRSDEERPLLDSAGGASLEEDEHHSPSPAESLSWVKKNKWIILALASGACAAFNGVFAKLTTTELTASFALAIARLLRLENVHGVVEIAVRCAFFGLNLTFNGVMWTLFTTALARGNSTTQVSVINTSSNFVLSALLGLIIFSETLPPMWWAGAALLVVGSVIVGRKDEGESPKVAENEPEPVHEGHGATVVSGAEDIIASSSRTVAHGLDTPNEEEEEEKDEDVIDLGQDIEAE